MIELTLYGRTCCHLCEDMKNTLKPLRRGFSFVLYGVDVDGNPVLEARLNRLVPVLIADMPETLPKDARELCHYFLDVQAVQMWLTT